MPETNSGEYTARSSINDVISDPVFSDYGRLLFPTERGYMSGDTLGSLGLTWYSHIDPAETVEIVNTLHERAASGETVFCDIYTDAEKAADPDKADTGLFSSGVRRARPSPCAARAGPLPTSARCRTASRTRWS